MLCVLALWAAPASGQALLPPGAPQVQLPASIPLFPLQEATLFPHASRPLLIFEPRYRAMVADALKGDRIIGMVRLRPGFEAEYEGRPPIDAIGCAGRITEFELLPDGRYTIVLEGVTRFRVVSEDASRAYRLARVEAVADAVAPGDAEALGAAREQLEALLSVVGIELGQTSAGDDEVVDTLAQYLDMASERRQQLLEMNGSLRRARALIDLLSAR
ncbi:MAG TPA: LON peptidase substrate-binding domain-containing protein [Vicinamibacterales bacterium]